MRTVLGKSISLLKICIFLITVSISCNVYAEYYVVYGEPSTEYVEVSPCNQQPYYHHYHHPVYHHYYKPHKKWVSHVKRSHACVVVYHAAPTCGCPCMHRVYRNPCFSQHVYQYRENYRTEAEMYGDDDSSFDLDRRTADDVDP